MAAIEPRFRGLSLAWLLWCVFIAYGSLLPFELRPAPPEGALLAFLHMPWLKIGLGGRLDWLANLLLYVPAGFLGTLALQQRVPPWDHGRSSAPSVLSTLTVLLLCGVLALSVEFAQIYVTPRTVSLNDVVAELTGAAIGCAAALMFGPYVMRLLASAGAGAGGSTRHNAWLKLYLLAYLGLSFFPFDVSAARAVFEQKMASGHAGWWWAPYQQSRPATAALKLLLEAALTLPFGVALAAAPRRLSWQRAGLWGLVLGAAIETVQLFLLSATSQGASVVSRAVGMVAGGAMAPHLPTFSTGMTRARLRAATGVLTVPWLMVVAYLGGWGRSEVSISNWEERTEGLSFLPFYYHYYVGEAQALTSVLQGIASYAWVGIGIALCWPRAGAAWAAVVATMVSTGIEASKLLLVGQRPDPTNVLVAATAAAMAWALMRRFRNGAPMRGATSQPTAAQSRVPPRTAKSLAAVTADVDGRNTIWALVVAAIVVAGAWVAPGDPVAKAVAVAAFTVCVWRNPSSALLLTPIAIALTDTASLTGQRWFELLDLVTLATLGVAILHPLLKKPAVSAPVNGFWLAATCVLLLVPSVLIGLQGAMWPDENALLGPLSPWTSLLLAKGFAGALTLAWFARRLRLDTALGAQYFGRGMVLALAGVVFLTVKERLAFVGPFDFSTDYRAPGPFTAIALGGAYIECFMSAAVPFAVVGAFRERIRVVRLSCAVLILAAAYATMVTYSRAGQVVFLAVVGASMLLLAIQQSPTASAGSRSGRLLIGFGLASAVALVAGAVLMAPYATARFKQLESDTQVRLDHWQLGMSFGRDHASATLLGNGLGSFGRKSYVEGPPAGRPGLFLLHDEGGNLSVHAHPGKLSYLDQRVDVRHGEPLMVSARMRTTQGRGLQALLCEKDLVQSRSCGVANLRVPTDGQWHRVEAPVTLPVNAYAGWPARPIRFTLFHGGGGVVEIDDISLRDEQHQELLRNGNFENRAEHWVYSSDMHLVWHMKNLWLQVFFEQGAIGSVAHATLLLAGLAGAWRAVRHSPWLLAFGMAMLAFQGIGLIDSVIDSPRFSQLYLSIAMLAVGFGHRGAIRGRRRAADLAPIRDG